MDINLFLLIIHLIVLIFIIFLVIKYIKLKKKKEPTCYDKVKRFDMKLCLIKKRVNKIKKEIENL